MTKHGWLVLCGILLMSCGPSADADDGDDQTDTSGGEDDLDDGTGDEPGDTVHASAIELIGINGPAVPWSEMGHEDREMDMISRFHPIFREVFIDHDAEEFAEFGCESCHGDDMRERNYEMPNPALPPLGPPGSPSYVHEQEEEPSMMTFMEEVVTPHMQTMLGTGETFTCNGCHPAP